mgnify:FL=1
MEKEKGLLSEMLFRSDGEQKVEWCATHIMWGGSQDLLRTHSDVIFCDSIWNVSKEKDRLLTIVVIDSDYKLKLAAMSLVHNEKEQDWENLFFWVKQKIPSFSPKCVVTDGASYIMSGFRNAVDCGAQNIVCWWHQSKNCEKSKGHDRFLKSILLAISYCENAEEIDEAVSIFQEKMVEYHPKNSSMLNAALLRNLASAFINLKVFTGNTITNSYAESVNAQLHRFGIEMQGTHLDQLILLQHFVASKSQTKLSTFDPQPLIGLFENDVFVRVTNGVLSLMVEKLKLAKQTCKLVEETDEHFKVEQLIKCTKNDWIFQKTVHWIVSWNHTAITCSCNGLTYGGVPCLHLLVTAWKKSKKIPLSCFNPRFMLQPPGYTEAHTPGQPTIATATEPLTSETNITPDVHGVTDVDAGSDDTTEAIAIAGMGAPVELENVIEHIDGIHTTTERDPLTKADHMASNESGGANAHTPANTTISQPSSLVQISTNPNEIHSNDMWLSLQFTSRDACYLRGVTQAISIYYLRALQNKVPLECIYSHVQSILQQVAAKAQEWDRQFAQQGAVMPHPHVEGRAQPYRPVPRSIARECSQRLQQLVSSIPHPPGPVSEENEESGEPVRQRPRTE